MPGGTELFVVLLIILIIFGAGKLPNVLKSMGQGVREFKNASSGEPDETKNNQTSNEDKPASTEG